MQRREVCTKPHGPSSVIIAAPPVCMDFRNCWRKDGAEPIIGPARGPHRASVMGCPDFGPDPLAPVVRQHGG